MIDLELKLPAEKKDEFGYTPSQNRQIEKQLTRPSPPKGTWKRFVKANEEADKIIAAKAKAAEAAKEKKHLKELILFGLENSSEPVIKNPVMRKALEAKPKKSVNYLSDNYSFAENFKKTSKNINNYKPTTKKPFKTVPKIKSGPPVKIDFNLDPMPMHTAGLWSNIKNSSIYKLLDHPKVMGVELGHEGIMEAYNLLQNSGLLKKGGRVK
tara:strand:+ start:1104 stop:1736 length:633 start_codon:yes stop_codon:yes gene_type:complete